MEVGQDLQAKLDQIAKLPGAVRAGIVAAIALVLAGGYFMLMYRDASAELEHLRGQELALQRKLSEVRSIAANIAEFEEEIASLELQLQKILRQLPNDKELEVLLTDISNLGKTAGIEIKSFKRKPEEVRGFYAEVPIDLEIEGAFHDVARFFDMLAGLPRIVNMGQLSLKVASEDMDSTILRVQGTATTFRFVGKGERA